MDLIQTLTRHIGKALRTLLCKRFTFIIIRYSRNIVPSPSHLRPTPSPPNHGTIPNRPFPCLTVSADETWERTVRNDTVRRDGGGQRGDGQNRSGFHNDISTVY